CREDGVQYRRRAPAVGLRLPAPDSRLPTTDPPGPNTMICVTLGRGRHSSLLAEWKAVAEAGAQLVELRIDCLRREPNLKRLFAERYTPVVFTVRRGVDGGL